MNKFLFSATIIVFNLFNGLAQVSLEISNYSTGAIIANNAVISETVMAGGQSHTSIKVKNIGTGTKIFGITRTDITMNPGSVAYFCFAGQCYTPVVFSSPASNQLTLTTGQSDLTGVLYYDENATLAGYSEVKYKIFDINNITDNIVFTFKFNSIVSSIKENNFGLASVSDVYPNPSTASNSKINITSNVSINDVEIKITNALGSVVSSRKVDLNSGKNIIELDNDSLNSGIYFVSISSTNHKIVKKFTITK
jgi:hypothetical protein